MSRQNGLPRSLQSKSILGLIVARKPVNVVEAGQRFGKLVVVEAEHGKKAGYRAALCKCDCGNDHAVRITLLLQGESKSCGCNRGQHERKTPSRPPVKKQLAGHRFGRLLVRCDSGQRNYKRGILWDCICDCGTEKLVETSQLLSGITSSCGCFQRESAGERKFVDHTGKRFGMLTVVSLHSRGRHGASCYARWLCRCDCGLEAIVRSNSLTQGEIISCGCAAGLGPKKAFRDPAVRSKASSRAATRRALEVGADGSFTDEEIAELHKKQRGRCAWCNKLIPEFHKDHRQALSKDGTNWIWNIELLCQPCNNKKHAKDEIAWANENGKLC